MAKNNTIGEFDGKIADKVVVLEGVVDLGNMNTPIVSVDGKAALAVYPLAGTADLQSLNNSISVIDGKLCRSSIAYDGVLDLQDLNSILSSVDDEMVIAVYIIEGTPTISSNTDKFISIDGKLAIAIHELDGFACRILKDAVLNLTTITNNIWTDAISGNNWNLVNSNAFEFNGIDNCINTGMKAVGGSVINIEILIKFPSAVVTKGIVSCGGYGSPSSLLGYALMVVSGKFEFRIHSGSSLFKLKTNVTVITNTDYLITVHHSGVNGADATVNINGTDYTLQMDTWSGDSVDNLMVGCYNESTPAGTYINAVYAYLKISDELTPFAPGEGDVVYNVHNDAEYTIEGTIILSNWVLWIYHYNIFNGFNIIGTAKIPASLLNIGLDVKGNALSNPALASGHNGAETEYLPPDIAAFKVIDTLNKLYTVGGDPIPQSFADTEGNVGNYLFFNIVDAANQKQQGVMFDPPLTIYQQGILDRCYLKSITIPEAYEAELDANGLLQYDSNYELLLLPIT